MILYNKIVSHGMMWTFVLSCLLIAASARTVFGPAPVFGSHEFAESTEMPVTSGTRYFGDRCTSTSDCAFGGSICENNRCVCRPDLLATNHFDKCGPAVDFNGICFFDEQCEARTRGTECRDNICTCLFEKKAIKNERDEVICVADYNRFEGSTDTPAEPTTSLQSKIICEDGNGSIHCPAGKTILIADAFYGRMDGTTCPGNIYTTNCKAPLSLDIIKLRCEHKRNCTLIASNAIFGDPCVRTDKYIQVDYQCVQADPAKCMCPSDSQQIIEEKSNLVDPETNLILPQQAASTGLKFSTIQPTDELIEFGGSIVAQLRMLPEVSKIQCMRDIQNLITTSRLQNIYDTEH